MKVTIWSRSSGLLERRAVITPDADDDITCVAIDKDETVTAAMATLDNKVAVCCWHRWHFSLWTWRQAPCRAQHSSLPTLLSSSTSHPAIGFLLSKDAWWGFFRLFFYFTLLRQAFMTSAFLTRKRHSLQDGYGILINWMDCRIITLILFWQPRPLMSVTCVDYCRNYRYTAAAGPAKPISSEIPLQKTLNPQNHPPPHYKAVFNQLFLLQ